jgi:queuosine precursor transporter
MEGGMRSLDRQRKREGLIFLVLFALTIPAANWLIGNAGTACVAPHGPCVVRVAPGLMAPSGVMMVGFALVLRDLLQRRLGTVMSALAILFGSGLSALLAPASLVDSIVFLWLAFGSLDFLAGQVVGKAWMVLLSVPFVAWLRRRDERLGIAPA